MKERKEVIVTIREHERMKERKNVIVKEWPESDYERARDNEQK